MSVHTKNRRYFAKIRRDKFLNLAERLYICTVMSQFIKVVFHLKKVVLLHSGRKYTPKRRNYIAKIETNRDV